MPAWAASRFAAATAPLAALVVFALLCRFLGSYFYLDFALADWAFAADLARRDVDGLEAVLERFTGVVVGSVRESDADEVRRLGVSLGAVMMAEAIGAGARGREPDLAG